MEHITESKAAKKFLKQCGIRVSEHSSFNAITLVNIESGEALTLWAESESAVAGGIPGIFIDTPQS